MTQSAHTDGKPSAIPAASHAAEAYACDPALHEQMVRPWDLCHTPRERGEFGYRMWYIRMPGITVYREIFDLSCDLQGFSPVDKFAFSVPSRVDSDSTYWGSSLKASDMPAMLPGGLDVRLERGHEQLVILIDSPLMRANLPEETVAGLEAAAARHRLPGRREDIRNLNNWLNRLIDEALQMPQMLQHAAVLQSLEQDIFRQLVNAVSVKAKPLPQPSCSLRRKGLNRALEYLQTTDLKHQSIPEISRAAGISQRTMEYAFRDAFGLSPLGFLKLWRMHRARRDLLFADPETATVMKIAYCHGFYHPSRFAKNYRQLFGELPSDTLKRSTRFDEHQLSPFL